MLLYCYELPSWGLHNLSLPSEVGWNLAPFLGFPLEDRDSDIVGAKPILGTGDNLVELFGLWSALQLGLALFLGHPELGAASGLPCSCM